MIQNSSAIHKPTYRFNQRGSTGCFALLILFFFLGCLGGSLLGSFFGLQFFLSDSFALAHINAPKLWLVFLHFMRFHLLAVVLGSTYYGLIFFPVLSFLRGYALSCTAASIISANPANGAMLAAISVGLPALFSLPCFFAISIESNKSALRILRLTRGQPSPAKDRLFSLCLSCLPVLALGTLVEYKLVPYLVSLLR